MTTAIKRNRPVLFILLSMYGRHGGHLSPRRTQVNAHGPLHEKRQLKPPSNRQSPHRTFERDLNPTLVISQLGNKRPTPQQGQGFLPHHVTLNRAESER